MHGFLVVEDEVQCLHADTHDQAQDEAPSGNALKAAYAQAHLDHAGIGGEKARALQQIAAKPGSARDDDIGAFGRRLDIGARAGKAQCNQRSGEQVRVIGQHGGGDGPGFAGIGAGRLRPILAQGALGQDGAQAGLQARVIARPVLQDAYELLRREYHHVHLLAVHGAGDLPVEGLFIADIRAGEIGGCCHGLQANG